ncbi:dihydroxyacetone kinase subunit DhaL [Leifsonia sp. Root112D2]|jgi:dihydroxyacetone kinase-like protein|uniref:dihydroxyacetone kinase subunit DhaL n=1 Tax=Leifsonia sp. Root112D2 TaxID=1736426 RepID=UPI0006FC6146|nr:dihydroxyacetone kinase subunit DhaL [Leifsonia sp. Root112D2]KQV08179.1 dihydroxyacetone kinase [Leifsonia sp. Root112D2]
MTLDATWTRRWLQRSAEVIAEHRSELGALDREIGDGDHGENLDRGFTAVLAQIETLPSDATPGALLRASAMSLISKVGGASGPLYGTALLKASEAVGDASSLDAAGVVALLTGARDGIVLRGKAESGDKTMVDAWTPAVDAAAAAAAAGKTPAETFAAAAEAAVAGAAATEPLVAHKGRASYLGERAIGHRDPGAQSTALILTAASDTAQAA